MPSTLRKVVWVILFNGVLFDRLLASFRERGNVGFLMYTADSIGYLGSISVLLWRNFGSSELSWVQFFTNLCLYGSVLVVVASLASWWYFQKKHKGIIDGSPKIILS